MLFGYPIEATEENWFHECMVEMLTTIHNGILEGRNIPDWPEIIPEVHREKLRTHLGLGEKIKKYITQAKTLTEDDLHFVDDTLNRQNEVEQLLSGICDCATLQQLPIEIQKPVSDLFSFGFKLLSDLGIRDRQYKNIFDSLPAHVCPFCGCEYFTRPGGPREDLDHFLAESKYSFAAVNLHNLVPMGHVCNSKYKLAQDILYRDDGITRRKSHYPYNEKTVKVSLNNSKPFSGNEGIFSSQCWVIDFEPNTEEIRTWDEVFHIKERYAKDVLDEEFKGWLEEFASWFRSSNTKAKTIEDVLNALQRYIDHLEIIGFKDRTFLKVAAFRMIYSECQQGNQRMIDILSSLVFGVNAFIPK